MTNADVIARAKRVLFQNYRTQPIAIVRGEGARAWDADGKRYLDCLGGIAVCVLGHNHPRVHAALEAQAAKLWHASNVYLTLPQIELAERLVSRSFAQRAFFCNSGAEAIEALIKLARHFHFEAGRESRVEIVCATNSFHGRTLGALAATGQPKYQKGFAPLPGGFVHVPFGDAAALERALSPNTAAVLLEPVQGEAGVIVPPANYLREVRALCDRHGALLLLDEVQTGLGRSGKMWAYEHSGITPDAMSFAKGIANGIPLGGILATEMLAKTLTPGTHGTTFGGNPLACAAACAVFDELISGVIDQGQRAAERLRGKLSAMVPRQPRVKDVRGLGMLIGIEVQGIAAAPVVAKARELGLLSNAAGESVIRLAPPLTLTDAEIDEAAEILESAITSAVA